MSLTELTLKKDEIENEIRAKREQHEADMKRLDGERRSVLEKLNFVKSGLDPDKIKHGLSIIKFGDVKGIRERAECVSDAISDLAAGCQKLKQQYFGTKNYAHWRDQRENHWYGYGPKHGSIVFEVGLNRTALEKANSVGLDENDIESAIYCLLNIDEINKQKSNANAA